MQSESGRGISTKSWPSKFGLRATTILRQRNQTVYSQGDSADALFRVQDGHVKLTVLSADGKEAVIAILGPGDFFGEACLAAQSLRHSSATAVTACVLLKVAKEEVAQRLKAEPALSEFLLSYVLSRNIHLEADLVDQLCNSCEKRLARTLLLLTHFAPSAGSATLIPKINQETLAAMVGTTQPRISFLLNKFKERGLIEYGEGLHVKSSLLKLILRDKGQFEEINGT